jgi:hypothetical protein
MDNMSACAPQICQAISQQVALTQVKREREKERKREREKERKREREKERKREAASNMY